MKNKARLLQIFTSAILALPIIAEAHPLHLTNETIGFLDGLAHPITSAEHVLTMLAFGLWTSQTGRRMVYYMAFVFTGFMLVGGCLTLIPVEIAHSGSIINLLILILCLILVSGCKIWLPAAFFLTACFALLHGYVHAYDILLDIDATGFTAGFALATLLMITIGITLGRQLSRFSHRNLTAFPEK